MRTSLAKLVALAALLVGPCWGCGSSSGTLAPLITVKGKVTYKGQPVTKGVVEFEPEGYGRPAKGQLQSDGTFELTTFKPRDGVVAVRIGSPSANSTKASPRIARCGNMGAQLPRA